MGGAVEHGMAFLKNLYVYTVSGNLAGLSTWNFRRLSREPNQRGGQGSKQSNGMDPSSPNRHQSARLEVVSTSQQ
jgi:hypothetical protein